MNPDKPYESDCCESVRKENDCDNKRYCSECELGMLLGSPVAVESEHACYHELELIRKGSIRCRRTHELR